MPCLLEIYFSSARRPRQAESDSMLMLALQHAWGRALKTVELNVHGDSVQVLRVFKPGIVSICVVQTCLRMDQRKSLMGIGDADGYRLCVS